MGRKKAVKTDLVEPVEPVEPVVETEKPVVETAKPKRKYTKKAPGETKSRKKKEEIALPIPPPVEESNEEPKFIETTEPAISITDVIVVKVKKIKCQGKDYYHDSVSGKLYGISVNGVGAYKGRYNQETETLDTTFPDSDCE